MGALLSSLAACADSTAPRASADTVVPGRVEIIELPGGSTLTRIDLEDAQVVYDWPYGRLVPNGYAAYGVLIDRAYVDSFSVVEPPERHLARSGVKYLRGMQSYDFGVQYLPITITFTRSAPGPVRSVRVHVARHYPGPYWPDDPPYSMTCYEGTTPVGSASARPPSIYEALPVVYLPLEVTGNAITRCVVQTESYFMMDDLEVTFARGAVSCTPATVTRGTEVVCRPSGTGAAPVARWEFEGDNVVNDATLRIVEPGPLAEWRGLAVESGTVTAVFADSTRASARFDVQDRTAGWNWDPSRWSYSQGTAALCDNTEPSPTSTYQLGWNRTAGSPKHHCGQPIRHRRILPILDLTPNAGYTVAAVPTGPNRGRWYVASASFHMARASNLNPEILPGGTTHQIRDTAHARLCRAGMGLAPTARVRANFYTFNRDCMGVPVDSLVAAAWGHEGFGFNGGTGHEGLAWAAAALPDNDPYVIEDFTGSTELELRNAIVTIVSSRSGLIEQSSHDPLSAGNWFGGSVWMWDRTQHKYVVTPLRAF